MPTEIPGDPGALRAAAARIRRAGQHAQDAVALVRDGQGRAAGGWSGAAHDAFAAAATATGGRVNATVRFTGAALVLEAYAAELEALQRQFTEARTAWHTAGGGAILPVDPDGRAAASRAMDGLAEQARDANERAAGLIGIVAAGASDEQQGNQDYVRAAYVLTGLTTSSGERLGDVMSRLTAGASSGSLLPAEGAAARWADVARAGRYGGLVLGPVLTGTMQSIDDRSVPYYSVGERTGRIVGQTLTTGGAALAGGALGAAAGSVVPGVGTAVGFAAGAITGYLSARWVDERNDAAVERFGEAGDTVQDGMEDLAPW